MRGDASFGIPLLLYKKLTTEAYFINTRYFIVPIIFPQAVEELQPLFLLQFRKNRATSITSIPRQK